MIKTTNSKVRNVVTKRHTTLIKDTNLKQSKQLLSALNEDEKMIENIEQYPKYINSEELKNHYYQKREKLKFSLFKCHSFFFF